MSYDYQKERANLFTPEGLEKVLQARDNVKRLLALAGAVRMDKAIGGMSGDSWHMLACIDYLVERGEIREITGECAGQDRVFVSTK